MFHPVKLDRTNSLSAYELKKVFGSCKVIEPELQKKLADARQIIRRFSTGDGLIPTESFEVEDLWRIAVDMAAADKGPRNAMASMLGDQALVLDCKLDSGSIYEVADRAMFASDELYGDSLELEY